METVIDAPSYRDIVKSVGKSCTNEQLISDDGYTFVQNKKKRTRNKNMFGTAVASSRLVIVDMLDAVYLSRLKNTTTVEAIKEHILSLGE